MLKRDIVFRGKSKSTGEWVEGSLIGNDVIVGKIVEFEEDYFCTEFWYKVDPETVGQFTGMTDKNGKKVFEGDIIIEKESDYDNEYRIYNIYWNEDNFQYWFSDDVTIDSHPIDELEIDYSRVIGNIYDNPELL